MASTRPLRTLASTATSSLRIPSITTAAARTRTRQTLPRTSACAFSSTASPQSESAYSDANLDTAYVPRWQTTPPRMKAPYRVRPRPQGPVFEVNEDPRKLDDAYNKMLGPGGDSMLSDEVKWLAVTHKSFDHGRRGFNDRLAFLGKRIIDLQTTQALLNSPLPPSQQWPKDSQGRPMHDRYGRIPFTHPALNGLPGLSQEAKDRVLEKTRLAGVAERYGMDRVTRWKPKKADNLAASGQDSVLVTTLYAVVGALALERGGDVANKVTRERILAPLGFNLAAE